MRITANQIKDKNAFVDIANPEYDNVDTIELLCSDKFDVEIIHEDKIVLKRKKPKYPTTYEECYKIIVEYTGSDCNPKGVMGYKYKELQALQKLLVCRDAYWKIAGEEMGLGKPWEPDWMNNLQHKHYISTEWDEIKINFNSTTNKVLAFPTEEMRDAFYKNFKDLIEECKELL